MRQTTTKCKNTCSKTLNCGIHKCMEICHSGDCQECPILVTQPCVCGSESIQVTCGTQIEFNCDAKCPVTFDCQMHTCQVKCHVHPPQDTKCPRDPSTIHTCPCGKVPVDKLGKRNSCQDPILCCGHTCGKLLECGHHCASMCHEGPWYFYSTNPLFTMFCGY
jgi:transcriptional repressor NF-X1